MLRCAMPTSLQEYNNLLVFFENENRKELLEIISNNNFPASAFKYGLNKVPLLLSKELNFINEQIIQLETNTGYQTNMVNFPTVCYLYSPHFIFYKGARSKYLERESRCNFCGDKEQSSHLLMPNIEHKIITIDDIQNNEPDIKTIHLISKLKYHGVYVVCIKCLQTFYTEIILGMGFSNLSSLIPRLSAKHKDICVRTGKVYPTEDLDDILLARLALGGVLSYDLEEITHFIDFGEFINLVDFSRVSYITHIANTTDTLIKDFYSFL